MLKMQTQPFHLDSGASDYMVYTKDWLGDIMEIDYRSIVLGDGNSMYATHIGTDYAVTKIPLIVLKIHEHFR